MSGDPLPASAVALRARLSEGLEEQLAQLRRLDPRKRAPEFAFFTACWAAGAAVGLYGLFAGAWPLRALGVLLAAVGLNAFMLLLHEGVHHLLARDRRANRGLGWIAGAPLFIGPTAFFVLHTRHHRFLGEPGDPDDYHTYTQDRRLVWLLHWARLTVGLYLYIVAIPFLALRHASWSDRRRIVVDYALMAGAWALAFALVPLPALAQAWLFPAILAGHMTAVRGLAQHTLTPRGDPQANARTLRPHRLVAFCLLHENHHLEHHLFPGIPSYHLPRLHALVWPRLERVATGTGYAAFLAKFVQQSATLDETPIGLEVRQ